MQGASDITTVIPVSEEMLAVIGTSAGARSGWPNNSVAFAIDLQSALAPASFRFIAMPSEEQLTAPSGEQSLFLIVRRNACERLRGGQLSMDEKQRCLLTPQLHPIVIAIRDCTLPAASALPTDCQMYRAALRDLGSGPAWRARTGGRLLHLVVNRSSPHCRIENAYRRALERTADARPDRPAMRHQPKQIVPWLS